MEDKYDRRVTLGQMSMSSLNSRANMGRMSLAPQEPVYKMTGRMSVGAPSTLRSLGPPSMAVQLHSNSRATIGVVK